MILVRELQVLRINIPMDDRRLMRMKIGEGVQKLIGTLWADADFQNAIK